MKVFPRTVAIFALTLLILQGLVFASWISGLALMLPSWASSTALIWVLRCYHPPAAANAAIPPFTAAPMPVYAGMGAA